MRKQMWSRIRLGQNNNVDRGLVRKPEVMRLHVTYPCRRQGDIKMVLKGVGWVDTRFIWFGIRPGEHGGEPSGS
jgi:hypothetical protein